MVARGTDTKQRYRRTNREIELEAQIKSLPDGDAKQTELKLELEAIRKERGFYSTETETDVIDVQDVKDVKALLKQQDVQVTGGVEYEPIEVKGADAAVASALNADAVALKVTQNVTKNVLDVIYGELETRTQAILNQVKEASQVRTVVAAIRFNEQDVRKLKTEAHPNLVDVLSLIKIGEQPLLVGPSGCGKTFLAEQAAEALQLDYGHLCFSAGVSETWLFGRQTPSGFVEGSFSKLYRNGGLFLADELDAADGNLLMTLNTALSNGHMYNPIAGELITRNKNFVCMAAANTYGKGGNGVYTARNRLDAATLQRFTNVDVTYCSNVEKALCPNKDLCETLQQLRKDLIKRGANEIVSYRDFSKAARMLSIGWSKEKIMRTLTASWPETLRKELVKP